MKRKTITFIKVTIILFFGLLFVISSHDVAKYVCNSDFSCNIISILVGATLIAIAIILFTLNILPANGIKDAKDLYLNVARTVATLAVGVGVMAFAFHESAEASQAIVIFSLAKYTMAFTFSLIVAASVITYFIKKDRQSKKHEI